MSRPEDVKVSLGAGMARSGMDVEQAWLRLVGLGGDLGALELEAYILGVLRPDAYHHDLIAQAINEHFIDEGGDHPVAYFSDVSDQ